MELPGGLMKVMAGYPWPAEDICQRCGLMDMNLGYLGYLGYLGLDRSHRRSKMEKNHQHYIFIFMLGSQPANEPFQFIPSNSILWGTVFPIFLVICEVIAWTPTCSLRKDPGPQLPGARKERTRWERWFRDTQNVGETLRSWDRNTQQSGNCGLLWTQKRRFDFDHVYNWKMRFYCGKKGPTRIGKGCGSFKNCHILAGYLRIGMNNIRLRG